MTLFVVMAHAVVLEWEAAVTARLQAAFAWIVQVGGQGLRYVREDFRI